MEVFYHNIYEYQKGLRSLALSTISKENQQKAEERLIREKISYEIHEIGCNKINIYHGDQSCIDVIKHFNEVNLCKLTPEQDFILGIMLGYDRSKQCERFLIRKAGILSNKTIKCA